jgi:hypothetical protein
MQPSEALSTAAQIAVALAGFAGIVVAFRSGSVHEWDTVDKFRLRLLLNNSVLPLSLSLFAMLLLTVEQAPPWIWRACSALALALTLPFAIQTTRGAGSLPEYRNQGATRAIYVLFGALGTGALILQAINLAVLNAFWAFFVTIFVHLVAAAFQFVRMILVRTNA